MEIHTPHVTFSYERDKDVENIQIGLRTVRYGRTPDSELNRIITEFGNKPSEETLSSYLEEHWKGKEHLFQLVVRQMQEYWDSIERPFFTHLADRMRLPASHYQDNLSGYFSSRRGSGYHASRNWFAVSLHNGTLRNTLTAMHEIMHIYFHKQWWGYCKDQGLSDANMWDIKEAVTVLLNLWAKDWVIDTDCGYEEHTELRKNIKGWFLESRDFEQTLCKACEYIKTNPQKSPSWITN